MSIEQIHPAIHKITALFEGGGAVYLYLIRGERIAIVDTGVLDTPAKVLEPALGQVGLALSDVDLILSTHVHMDHTGGTATTKGLSGASLCLHSGDLAMAHSKEAQVEFMNAPFRELGVPAQMLEQRAGYILRNCGDTLDVDRVLSDGDEIDLGRGVKLSVVHTPGHTPGSVCYYWASEGVLITGDAIQGHGARIGAYPSYVNASDYRNSLSRLSALDFRMVAMSHPFPGGGPTNPPVRLGGEARSLVEASIQAADTMQKVMAEVMRRMPGAERREIGLAALSELIFHIPQVQDRATRMPRSAAPGLVAHMDAVADGSYPA